MTDNLFNQVIIFDIVYLQCEINTPAHYSNH